MCDSISCLLHERKKAIKVMRLFHQSLVDLKAEPIAIGGLFNIALLSIVAYAMWARKVFEIPYAVQHKNSGDMNLRQHFKYSPLLCHRVHHLSGNQIPVYHME